MIRGWFSSRVPSLDVGAHSTIFNDSFVHLASRNEIYMVVHTLTRESPPHHCIFMLQSFSFSFPSLTSGLPVPRSYFFCAKRAAEAPDLYPRAHR